MGTTIDIPSEAAYVVLDESMSLIDTALISYYGFTETESEAFKDTLAVWFHRVTRRSGSRVSDPRELREQLLFVACKYARAFQIAKTNSSVGIEDQLATALRTPPEEVAFALLNRIHAAAGSQ